VLRSAGWTVLVDTGLGNDKSRAVEVFHMRSGDFLDRLAAAGVRPEDVDVVVNTHLHNDHVGWNTRLVDGEWVPTFPNAQYLISRVDYDYWNPVNGHVPRSPFQSPDDTATTFDDSVLPVERAGQAVLWDGESHHIDADLTLELAPGHTPGSAVLRLESGTDRALFVGDLIHTPLQMIETGHDTCLSEDEVEATRSRRRILEQAVESNSLVVPAHLTGCLWSPQATQTFSRSGVCSLGLFHTTAQIAAARHPLAEQIAGLSCPLTGPVWQAGVTCSQDRPARRRPTRRPCSTP
jgi:glyoxylase-like metal-dependent hydrolase (beta-lactamase superfamily II)